MKILRSIHSLDPAGGGPLESIKQSSVVLAARGHDIEIICLDSPEQPWLRNFPVAVHALGRGTHYGYTSRLVSWLKDRHRNFDAVIIHGLWLYNGFGVWRALRGSPTPYFVFPHGMLDPWFKRAYPLKHLKKMLYWRAIEHRVLKDAAAVLFTSEEERRLARKSFSPYECNETVVNYGTAGPDVDLVQARESFLNAFPQLRGKQIFLFLGRLHDKKGCDLLIESFSNIHDDTAHLVIAGPCADPNYLTHLQHLTSKVANPVTFTGMIRGPLKWGAFAAADAFVLPSHQENFGMAVAEALACGTPVLISSKVNIWREIEQERAGYVENDDVAGTTRLLQHWTATAEQDRKLMRANAKQCFARHFEINRATDSLLSSLQTYVGQK